MAKDMKNIGRQTSVVHTAQFDQDYSSLVYGIIRAEGWPDNNKIGFCKVTWYVRMHGRARL